MCDTRISPFGIQFDIESFLQRGYTGDSAVLCCRGNTGELCIHGDEQLFSPGNKGRSISKEISYHSSSGNDIVPGKVCYRAGVVWISQYRVHGRGIYYERRLVVYGCLSAAAFGISVFEPLYPMHDPKSAPGGGYRMVWFADIVFPDWAHDQMGRCDRIFVSILSDGVSAAQPGTKK